MLPNPEHVPPGGGEGSIDLAISRFVATQFKTPKVDVGTGYGAMLWTAMPETTVHEYGEAAFRKYEIRAAEYGRFPAPAGELVFAKKRDESQLRRPVSASFDAGHDVGSFFPRENVRHGGYQPFGLARL
jgi:hypothetical protein